MRTVLVVLACVTSTCVVFGQLNMSLVAHKTYDEELSDVWGWVDPDDSTEYALVGVYSGLSIVSLTDPANPQEVQFIPGPNSIWRDIKTWGNHIYVINETSNGLLVVDMSQAPDSISWYEWSPELNELGQLESCHNLYIDEFGYCYLAGCNLNGGGMLILDVFSTPGTPQFVAAAPPYYAHDVYARDNRMYAAEIYQGRVAIYDVSDKTNIQLLATQQTPFQFTHNTWLNDAGDVVFTTDEKGNAPVTAYDISDLNNIVELDQFVPLATIGQGVIPHNVHVWNDYLIISYYTAGGIIVDASHPDNLIEVANFDTFFGGHAGFNGVWGAYPFLPSGLVLLTDISNGLFVLQPNYVRACRLEGQVTDSQTGLPIVDVEVIINSPQPNSAQTDLLGNYKTGQAIAGTFEVSFSAVGYVPKTVQATLANGQLTILDVQLDPLVNYMLAGQVISQVDGAPIPGAKVLLQGVLTYEVETDTNGQFVFPQVIAGNYEVFAGAWGYHTVQADPINLQANGNITIPLPVGYYDDFMLDLGWQVSGDALTGMWELGQPVGTFFQGQLSNPEDDVDYDIGDRCYVTGNGGGSAGFDDVDDGVVVLTSPPMDLSNYIDPVLTYSTWFFNAGGGVPPNDTLTVRLSNGTDVVILEQIVASASEWNEPVQWHLKDYIDLTDQMTVQFITSDLPESGHLVEAAIDAFRVEEGMVTSVRDPAESIVLLRAWPNPFSHTFFVSWKLETAPQHASLQLIDSTGKMWWKDAVDVIEGQRVLTVDLPAGVYWLYLESDGKMQALKQVVRN